MVIIYAEIIWKILIKTLHQKKKTQLDLVNKTKSEEEKKRV